jgi:hypothetical protein
MVHTCVQRFDVMERECKNLKFERDAPAAHLAWYGRMECGESRLEGVVLLSLAVRRTPSLTDLEKYIIHCSLCPLKISFLT